MTQLPTRKEIIKKAVELWIKDRVGVGDSSFEITPEVHELSESGYLSTARSILMRDFERSKSEEWIEYSEHIEKHDKFQICYEINEQKESNTLIAGTNKTGKSRLACNIASILQNVNWKIIAFDPVGNYKTISDIPSFYTVTKERNYNQEKKEWFYPFPEDSLIYDLSLITPRTQKSFVNDVLEILWNNQVKKGSKWTLIILEEFQLFGRNLRGSVAQNLLRICSAGRNHKIRILAVSVDLALIDPAFIRLTSQRYYGRLNIEENSKRKFRNYHGLDWCRIATELELGYFIYLLRDKLRVINIPCFETKRRSQALEVPQSLSFSLT